MFEIIGGSPIISNGFSESTQLNSNIKWENANNSIVSPFQLSLLNTY
jgi:hypothetical protein